MSWNQEVLLFAALGAVLAFDGVKRCVHWVQDRHRDRGLPRLLAAPLYRLRLLDPDMAAMTSPGGASPR